MPIVRMVMLTALLSAAWGCAPAPAPKEYAYPSWGFAVSFRGPPKETDSPAAADGTTVHTLLVESNRAGRDDLVNVIDGSRSTKPEDQALADAPATLAGALGGTIELLTYAASGGAMGREFRLNRPGRPAARVRIFVANKHLYEIIAQSKLGPDDPESARFLASFRLLGKP